MTVPSDPAPGGSTRELAAIMFSDIVGYTAIMGRDEREGLRAVREHREHLRAVLPQDRARRRSEYRVANSRAGYSGRLLYLGTEVLQLRRL